MITEIYTRQFSLGEIISTSWAVYKKIWKKILFVIFFINIPLYSVFLMIFFERKLSNILILNLISGFINIIVAMVIILFAKATIDSENLGIKKAFRMALSKLPKVIITKLWRDVLLILLSIFLIFPAIIFFFFWSFSFYETVFHDKWGSLALRASYKKVKGRFWHVFGYLSIIGIVALILCAGVMIGISSLNNDFLRVFLVYISIIIIFSFVYVIMSVFFLNLDSNRSKTKNENDKLNQAGEKEHEKNGSVKYAGFWIRWVAYTVDFVIIFFVTYLACIGLKFLLKIFLEDQINSISYYSIVFMFIGWIYYVALTYKYGKTIGKKIVGIKVISQNFLVLTFWQVMLRETIGKKIAAFIFYIGFIMAGITKQKQGLFDMMAKTRVIHDESTQKTKISAIIFSFIVSIFLVPLKIFGIIMFCSFSLMVIYGIFPMDSSSEDCGISETALILGAKQLGDEIPLEVVYSFLLNPNEQDAQVEEINFEVEKIFDEYTFELSNYDYENRNAVENYFLDYFFNNADIVRVTEVDSGIEEDKFQEAFLKLKPFIIKKETNNMRFQNILQFESAEFNHYYLRLTDEVKQMIRKDGLMLGNGFPMDNVYFYGFEDAYFLNEEEYVGSTISHEDYIFIKDINEERKAEIVDLNKQYKVR